MVSFIHFSFFFSFPCTKKHKLLQYTFFPKIIGLCKNSNDFKLGFFFNNVNAFFIRIVFFDWGEVLLRIGQNTPFPRLWIFFDLWNLKWELDTFEAFVIQSHSWKFERSKKIHNLGKGVLFKMYSLMFSDVRLFRSIIKTNLLFRYPFAIKILDAFYDFRSWFIMYWFSQLESGIHFPFSRTCSYKQKARTRKFENWEQMKVFKSF